MPEQQPQDFVSQLAANAQPPPQDDKGQSLADLLLKTKQLQQNQQALNSGQAPGIGAALDQINAKANAQKLGGQTPVQNPQQSAISTLQSMWAKAITSDPQSMVGFQGADPDIIKWTDLPKQIQDTYPKEIGGQVVIGWRKSDLSKPELAILMGMYDLGQKERAQRQSEKAALEQQLMKYQELTSGAMQ